MVSQAIAPRQAKNRPFRMIKGVSTLSDLADGSGVYGYPGDYPGFIYYVNNITGHSSFDGLSWATPFAQVSEAITASELSRKLPSGTENDFVRNIIFIQGTGTSYDAIDELPSYCDMVGIGADPRGDGTGIVVIKGEDADGAAGAARGLGLYSIQFAVSGGTSYSAMDVTLLLRSTIENCTFMGSTINSATSRSAFRATGSFAGNTVRNCHFGGTNGPKGFNIGFEQTAGGGNNNIFQNNSFFGLVHGVVIPSDCDDHATVWKDNVMTNYNTEVEPTTAGFQMGLHAFAAGNYIVGADAITEAAAAQTLGNFAQAGGTTVWEDSQGFDT